MKGFNFTYPNCSHRTASEPSSSFKRSAKVFSLKKASLHFHYLAPRRSHDCFTSNSTSLPPPVRASTHIQGFSYGEDVICISREDSFDSSSADDVSPDELRTPSASPYPFSSSSSSTASSSSSYHLPPEIDDQSLSPIDETLDEFDPRRSSQLSIVSSWVDHHLQELDLSYNEDGVYEIQIVTTNDGFPLRRDSFILPPGETFQSYRQKRNLPVVPAKRISRLSRPLPCTPPESPGFTPQSKRIRPLPPPPSP